MKLLNYEFYLSRKKTTVEDILRRKMMNTPGPSLVMTADISVNDARNFFAELGLTCPPDEVLTSALENINSAIEYEREKSARAARFAELAATKAHKTQPRRKKKAADVQDEKPKKKKTDEKYFRRVVSPKKKSK